MNTNAVYATRFHGALTGNVTGNVSGSSGSCTGNAATITSQANSATTTAATAATANTIALRDGSGDITTRLVRSTYSSTQALPASGYIMGQVNTSSDNYLRPHTAAQIRTFLNVANGANAYSFPYTITSANTANTV